jgi:hypothetical protein
MSLRASAVAVSLLAFTAYLLVVHRINDLGTITGAAHFGGTPGTWKGFTATCH